MVKKQAKPKTGMDRPMQLAATKKPLMLGSVVLSPLASLASFILYICMYLIMRSILGPMWPPWPPRPLTPRARPSSSRPSAL